MLAAPSAWSDVDNFIPLLGSPGLVDVWDPGELARGGGRSANRPIGPGILAPPEERLRLLDLAARRIAVARVLLGPGDHFRVRGARIDASLPLNESRGL